MPQRQDGKNLHLHAVVDMGSNGIRFSITSLDPSIARLLLSVYHHRSPISLHDAQFVANSSKRQPIPRRTIDAVTSALKSFKKTCDSYAVPDTNITVVATEATRTASNSDELLSTIEQETGWNVQLLSKEDEARLGALGVAASVPECKGLVMDLGGGSLQLSWVRTHEDGSLPEIGAGPVSMPYGAAAVMRLLADKERYEVLGKIRVELATAIRSLDLPDELIRATGIPLYLSGGGFRGWGYLGMASKIDGPSAIQSINGYVMKWLTGFPRCTGLIGFAKASKGGDIVQAAENNIASNSIPPRPTQEIPVKSTGIPGVSARRLAQLPAIEIIVQALAADLGPAPDSVTFCAGGVPTGILYSRLGTEDRSLRPLAVAAQACAREHFMPGPDRKDDLYQSLKAALTHREVPVLVTGVLPAVAHLVNFHNPVPKDARALSALHLPLTGSIHMVSGLGISHVQRITLALVLFARWGGLQAVSADEEEFVQRLRGQVEVAVSWWAEAVGRLCSLILDDSADVKDQVVKSDIEWNSAKACHVWKLRLRALESKEAGAGEDRDAVETDGLTLETHVTDALDMPDGLRKAIKSLEKLGKKKERITTTKHSPLGGDGQGELRIKVEVEEKS